MKNRNTKKTRGGEKHKIIIYKWPKILTSCDDLNNIIKIDECFRELKEARENPYFLSDKVSGYTNNGFFNGWGNENPSGVTYIKVKNTKDISYAIKYGIKNNKKIIVKNTGHDYLGRSFPKENMLVILTHEMENVKWTSDKFIIDESGNKKKRQLDFEEEFKDNCHSQLKYNKGYCTVDAGVQWWKVFDYMNKNKNVNEENRIDVWAMKGASNTVGAAGGWILDGGFSSFTKLFGMGVDNILSMEVVLADGTITNISNCINPELFFAFRGGGACNFGIVSNVTYRLLEALTSFGDFFIQIPISNEIVFKNVFSFLLKSNLLVDKHFAGTIQIFKEKIDIYLSYANITYEEVKVNFVEQFISNLETLNIKIKMLENTDISQYTGDLFFGNKNKYNCILSAQPNSNLHEKNKKFTPSHNRWWEYESYNDFIVAFGSRYLLINDIKDEMECSTKFLNILENTNMIQLETSKGLYGADQNILNINSTSSVNPKVQEAIGLVYIRSYLKDFIPIINQPYEDLLKVSFKYESNDLIFNDWEENIKLLQNENYENKCKMLKEYILNKAKISSDRTKLAIKTLRESFGDNSTYINHSDINEPNFGEVFWGEKNFDKLIELKKKYDPTDVFNHKYSIPLHS